MSYTYYCVKTARGYVGRWDLQSPLSDDHPSSAAYCYDDLAKAIVVAKLFANSDVLKITRSGSGQRAPRVAERLDGATWVPHPGD